MIDTNIIHHWDCREILKTLPENSVDMIYADPPYYLQLPWNGKRLKRWNWTEVIPVEDERDKFESYNDYDNFTLSWLSEAQRVLKPTWSMYVMWMYHNIYRVWKIMQDLWLWFLNEVIRVKKWALPNFNWRRMTNNHETLIWCVKNKDCKKYTFKSKLFETVTTHYLLRGVHYTCMFLSWTLRKLSSNLIRPYIFGSAM